MGRLVLIVPFTMTLVMQDAQRTETEREAGVREHVSATVTVSHMSLIIH